MQKFFTKDGFLTGYAHACGYLDVADLPNDKEVIVMGREGAVHFVKMAPGVNRPRVWDTFDGPNSRKDARARFLELIRQHGATRRFNK